MPSIVALIPARAGSTRCPGKNTRLLGGKPLIQWTIEAAYESEIFDRIDVCTDDVSVTLPGVPPCRLVVREAVPDNQPDIVWVREALRYSPQAEAFAILRPTSPFRTAQTIRDAWTAFQIQQPADSLRAVRPVHEHPYKMWRRHDTGTITPLLHGTHEYADGLTVPWHSCPTQTLDPIYVQTAGLEIAWTAAVREQNSISGTRVIPFFGDTGVDINSEADFAEAECLAELRA